MKKVQIISATTRENNKRKQLIKIYFMIFITTLWNVNRGAFSTSLSIIIAKTKHLRKYTEKNENIYINKTGRMISSHD